MGTGGWALVGVGITIITAVAVPVVPDGWQSFVAIFGGAIGVAFIVIPLALHAARRWNASYSRQSQLRITSGDGEPYQQRWDDHGGHQTLWRLRIKNRSDSQALEQVSIAVSSMTPWAIQGIPAKMRIRNQLESVQHVDVPPGGEEFFDIIQQSQPSGALLLWHIVPGLDKHIATQPYDLTITAFAKNSPPRTVKCRITCEGQNNTCALIIIGPA